MDTNVDQLPSDLAAFLAQMSADRQPPTRARYARVLAHLERFTAEVDLDLVSLHLGTDCAALLGAERDFGSAGSFWRVLGYDELVCLLPAFVDREWHLPRPADARTQLSLTARLLPWMRNRRIIDMQLCACAYWEAEYAVKDARDRLGMSRR